MLPMRILKMTRNASIIYTDSARSNSYKKFYTRLERKHSSVSSLNLILSKIVVTHMQTSFPLVLMS